MSNTSSRVASEMYGRRDDAALIGNGEVGGWEWFVLDEAERVRFHIRLRIDIAVVCQKMLALSCLALPIPNECHFHITRHHISMVLA